MSNLIVKRIEGTTRELGKQQGYHGLPIRDITFKDAAYMTSLWELHPDGVVDLCSPGGVLYIQLLTPNYKRKPTVSAPLVTKKDVFELPWYQAMPHSVEDPVAKQTVKAVTHVFMFDDDVKHDARIALCEKNELLVTIPGTAHPPILCWTGII